jgi:hypothetical protein
LNYQDLTTNISQYTGTCDTTKNLNILSRALTLLANSNDGLWDGMVASMDISAQDGYVTLPRDVQMPLAINTDNLTTFPRDRWFEHHWNGPGTVSVQPRRAWDDQGGEYAFFKEFAVPTGSLATAWRMRVTSENAADDGDTVRIKYLDSDDRVQTFSGALNSAAGLVSGVSVTAKQLLDFYRPAGDGWVKVWQYIDGTDANDILVGFYYADETNPRYRRIRVNANSCIRMTYRRRALKLTTANDFIPLDNEQVILTACRAIFYADKGQNEQFIENKQIAVALLEEDQSTKAPYSPVGPQVVDYSENYNESIWGQWSTATRYS